MKTISLDRLQASLALAGVKPPTVEVQNTPPQVIVSYSPAILVPIDGAPVMQAVPGHPRAQRVINTRALILQGGFGDSYYIHVYDGWLQSNSLTGPWTQAIPGPFMSSEMNAIADELSKKGVVDLLNGGAKANPKPSLANGVPAIYTSQVPTELIVFKGQPDFVPIVGTQLLWASNTTSDVLIDTATSNYYVLLAGRWFRGRGLAGPWTFVAEQRAAGGLRADSAALARRRRAADGRRHAAGAGSGDRELDSADGDGAAQERPDVHAAASTGRRSSSPIPGTSLSYVTNSSVPIDPGRAERVLRGRAPASGSPRRQLTGPWTIATSVPPVIYTIPPSSPIYLRHLRAHLRGDAAGRLRRLHARLPRHGRRAVRHGRLRHRLRLLAVDRHRLVPAAVHVRRRRGAGLQPVRRLHVRLRDGTRDRGVDGAVLGRRLSTTRATGAAIRAARRRAPTSTATGATRRTRARAPGTRAAASRARPRAAATTTAAPARRAPTTPAASTTRGPATRRAATTAR